MTDTQTALEALKLAKRMIDEALPKFNWGASHLDNNAIQLLNEAPIGVNSAIAALQSRTEQRPVGYQYQHNDQISGQPYWHDDRYRNGVSSNISRPLYTSPPSEAARIAELEAEKRELLDALAFIDKKDWEYLEGVLKRAVRHEEDSETTIWLAVVSKMRTLHAKLKGDA